MADPAEGRRQLVHVHCGWPRDREHVVRLLDSLGVDVLPDAGPEAWRRALESDQVDLVLADASGGLAPLGDLLRSLDARREWAEVPLVLLAEPTELVELAELTVRRFNAVILTKPLGYEQLTAAVESALKFRSRQREVRDLLRLLAASNERLAAVNAELERRREEAAEEARRKTRFLAAISHDIRTPVNALILTCRLLRSVAANDPQPGEVFSLTEGMEASAAALIELINDLLDIARYDQGKVEYQETEFPLGPFLNDVLTGLRPLAAQKALTLAWQTPDPGARLRADRVKLARVLQNLVSNAIKFTESGGVSVSARASAASGLRLAVRDTGVGVPLPMRETIFDEFAQLRNPERDRTKGTGLGLAICRRLVAGMEGEIHVEGPPPGEPGSVFVVELPPSRVVSDPGPLPPPNAAPSPAPPAHLEGRVLLVEDHEPSRVILRRLLGQHGLSVDLAANGRQALASLENERPHVVLLDLMMPEMGGAEVLATIRNRPDWADLPVVILTGDVSDRGEVELLAAGATACLDKPLDLPVLLNLLDGLLPGRDHRP